MSSDCRISQHIRFKTDQGKIKGHVRDVTGKAVTVSSYSQFPSTAQITSVATIGKEGLTDAGSSRAGLILMTFQGRDVLLSSPFVRKIFFPEHPLDNLKWPQLPLTQPNVNFTYRQLNTSQRKAVEKCLSNSEEDRHVVIIVSQTPLLPSPYLILSVSGATGYREDDCNRRNHPQPDGRAQI